MLTSFVGDRLKVDVDVLKTPLGTIVASMRTIGSVTISERRTIVRSINYVSAIDDAFVVLDASEAAAVDPFGAGEILLLNGHLLMKNRHFSLVLREGMAANFLRKYGVVDIVRSRPQAPRLRSSSRHGGSRGAGAL